jgi:hypothetical protein
MAGKTPGPKFAVHVVNRTTGEAGCLDAIGEEFVSPQTGRQWDDPSAANDIANRLGTRDALVSCCSRLIRPGDRIAVEVIPVPETDAP